MFSYYTVHTVLQFYISELSERNKFMQTFCVYLYRWSVQLVLGRRVQRSL